MTGLHNKMIKAGLWKYLNSLLNSLVRETLVITIDWYAVVPLELEERGSAVDAMLTTDAAASDVVDCDLMTWKDPNKNCKIQEIEDYFLNLDKTNNKNHTSLECPEIYIRQTLVRDDCSGEQQQHSGAFQEKHNPRLTNQINHLKMRKIIQPRLHKPWLMNIQSIYD